MNEVETKSDARTNGDHTQARNLSQTPEGTGKVGVPSAELSLRFFRDEAEILAISSALNKTGWNRKRAAQLLSISYRGLLYKIRRHNIAPPAERS
jgi:two-component system, NtrC family, response regulator AtoC